MTGAAKASKRYGRLRWFFNGLAVVGLLSLTVLAAANDKVVIVALGDSLTAGFGLPQDEAFSTQLEDALAAADIDAQVINAGVSGDTSAGGRARLDWVLADTPDLVIVELGANDGLRGIDPEVTFANLDDILGRLTARDTRVLLAGMLAPPNLGREYGEAFNEVYPRLAEKHGVVLYPFFLDGVAATPELNQADGIHPNREGVAVIVDRIMPFLAQALAAQDGEDAS